MNIEEMITMINSAKRKMKSEGKRIYVKALIITLISLMCSVRAWSQAGVIYPVDINVTLTPPYGTCLTDLTNSDRFRIQALMRDMSHPEYEMVIQMMIRDLSSLSPVFISTTNAFSLTAGEPTKIIGRDVSFASIADFFNFQNIRVGVQYVGTKCLPEGAYLFSFQAFDAKSYRTNRIPISREVTFSAFLEGGEVPILTYPAQNDSICDVQSIHFTWMQPFVSSGVNTYRLQVVKSVSEFSSPTGMLESTSTNERLEVSTTIPSYPYHNTNNFLEDNTTYYWRVVMCDANGNARLSYPNKGASEVRSFVYCGEKKTPEPDPDADWVQKKPQVKSIKDNLDVVKLIKAEEDGPDVVRAFCKKDEQEIREKYSGIIVEVKKKSHDTWTPFNIESQSVEDTSVSLGNLAYNELYEARAQYYIDEGESTTYAPYSETIEFTISNPADTIECGSPLPELNSDCTEAPKELKEGDKFSANGANVTVLEITSQSVEGNKLKISGTGYVNFPILRNFKLKVKFENAVLNCNLQLEDGTVESVYDLSTAATIDLNNLLGKGAGGYDLPETDPSIVDIPGIDPDNCEECKSYESGTLFSSGGEVYMKDENGAVVSVGKEIDLSTSGEYESNEIRKDNILVWFSNPDPANIAFDNDSMGYYRNIASINDQYTLFATNYITPWVANNPGRVVTLTAKPDDGFTNSGYTGLTFILKTSSTSYVELNNIKNSDGTYNVDIPGTDPSNITHIYAIARPAAGKPYENVGQLKVACYEKKKQKVILVPVANVEPNAETVKSYLTSVYGKLGYSFEVEVDNDKSHVEGINSDQISISSGVFTQYSDEMSSVINTYTSRLGDSYDKSAAYLFLMKKASGDNASVGGIMPQKHQFGFIFLGGTKDVDNRTIAHELGHGLWGLDHTFVKAYKIPEGTTPHLMDYNNGIYLAHFEWSQIDKPVKSWALFNSDKDNEGKGIKAKIARCVGISLAKVLIDKTGEEVFDAIIKGFLSGEIQKDDSEGFDISVSSISSLLADAMDEVFDGDCLSDEEKKGDIEALKMLVDVISFVSDAYDCYANAQSQAELDVCLCKVFASQGLDIIIDLFGGFLDEVKKAEEGQKPDIAQRIKEARDGINNFLEKHKIPGQIARMSGEELGELIKTAICGVTPEEPEMGKNAEDFFRVVCSPWEDKFEIKVLTKQEGLTEISYRRYDKDNKPVGDPIRLTKNDIVKCSKSLNYYRVNDYTYKKLNDESAENSFKNVLNIINKVYKEDCGSPTFVPIMTTCQPHLYRCYCLKQIKEDPNGYKDNTNPGCYCATDKVYYTYDFYVKCPEDGGYYEIDFWGQITDKEGGILGMFQSETTKSVHERRRTVCPKQPEVQTSHTDEPKPKYPIYLDDECYDPNDNVYIQNPFGKRKQTGPSTYEKSPREKNEFDLFKDDEKYKHGIPKCSGWKLEKEENGCKTYSVSPRLKCSGKYIPNMYTVTMCNGKVTDMVMNNVDFSLYPFDLLEYWDGYHDIIVEDKDWKGNYSLMSLDDFVENVTKESVLFEAFVASYAYWEWCVASDQGGGAVEYRIKNTLPKSYNETKSFVRSIYRTAMMNFNTSNIVSGNDKINRKFVREAIALLPSQVVDKINKVANIRPNVLKEKLANNCPAECVFADVFYDIAIELSKTKYSLDYGGKTEEDIDVQSDLKNYLSILGWKLYCGRNDGTGKDYNGMRIGELAAKNHNLPVPLTPEGAKRFGYFNGVNVTFPNILIEFLQKNKCGNK